MKIVDRYISIEYFGKKPRQCYERSCFIKHGETCRITPKKALFFLGGGGGEERWGRTHTNLVSNIPLFENLRHFHQNSIHLE